MTTLQQQFPAPKFRPASDSQTNFVYKIPCADCSWYYIGETGRAFNTRRKEHIRNVKRAAKGSKNADDNSCPLPGQNNILFTHIHD